MHGGCGNHAQAYDELKLDMSPDEIVDQTLDQRWS